MKSHMFLFLAAFNALLIFTSCLDIGEAFSQQAASLSGKLDDLKNTFENAAQSGLTGMSNVANQAKDAVSNAVSNAQSKIQDAMSSGSGSQISGAQDAIPVAANTAGSSATKVGDTVGTIVDKVKDNSISSRFWNKDAADKLHKSAQGLLTAKGIDAKYDAPKADIANYMLNVQSQPNITEMINIATKTLSPDEASKFFEQMASVATAQNL